LHSSRWVVRLTPPNDNVLLSETELGGKGWNLLRLARLGFPVPAAFCITANAYREHLESTGLGSGLQKALKEINPAAGPGARQAELREFRRSVMESLLSEALQLAIQEAFLGLDADRVAVRSSASAEDSRDHSFAGQFDTFLGVEGLPAILDAIKASWASLWSDRAFEYRIKKELPHVTAAMAVIVQTLVAAEVSGVVFTSDPVHACSDHVVIESCWGLGDSLVQGKLTPDRMVLSRTDRTILSKQVAVKSSALIVSDGGGVREEIVDSPRAEAPCLDDKLALGIVDLALQAENAFGVPQDLEWTYSGNKISVLQSRPITTLVQKARSFEDRQVWSNLNSGEVLPDVVSPMTWSRIDPLLHEVFGSIIGQLGMEFRGSRLAGLVAGRAYFNLNTCVAIFRRIPGLRNVDLGKALGGAQGRRVSELKFADQDLPHLNFSLLRMAVKLPGFLLWTLSRLPNRGMQEVVSMQRRTTVLERIDPSTLSEDDIMSHIRLLLDDPKLFEVAITYGGGAMAFLPPFFELCRRWFRDHDASIANRLLAGLGGMDSAEAGLDLWRLAQEARQHPAVEKIVAALEEYSSTRGHLQNVAGGAEFLARWDAFMARHGHHCRGEVELLNPRWRETPDVILGIVRGYLNRFDSTNPAAVHESHALKRRELAGRCRDQLWDPFRRGLFDYLLGNAQRGCIVRENLKSEVIRGWALARSLLLELSRRLCGRGVLQTRDDVFFLRFEELEPIRKGLRTESVAQTVASRRAEYNRNKELSPPAVVVGRFDPSRVAPGFTESNSNVLKGLAVSPGVVTGPARVVLRSDTGEQVLPGEILVAPFTDPGWTPYFLQAAGIVMDLGGLLSHGSIIAREYGIPAVVNVGPATRKITSGQMLQVDGHRGEVQILSSESNPNSMGSRADDAFES
jgi:pyruvate,water dikinase